VFVVEEGQEEIVASNNLIGHKDRIGEEGSLTVEPNDTRLLIGYRDW
jgi:hypothetical protein